MFCVFVSKTSGDSDTSIKSSNIFQFSSPRQVEKNTATIAELSIFTDSNIANSENTALLKKVAHTKTKIFQLLCFISNALS